MKSACRVLSVVVVCGVVGVAGCSKKDPPGPEHKYHALRVDLW